MASNSIPKGSILQKATDRIETRWLNRWVKDRICEEGMDYLKELADVLLPGGVGGTQMRIIAEDHRSIKACFTEFFKRWSERVVDSTWEKLIDALVETKKEVLAKEIGNALTPPVMVPRQAADQQQRPQPIGQKQVNNCAGDDGDDDSTNS